MGKNYVDFRVPEREAIAKAKSLGITSLKPLKNLTYNYVASGSLSGNDIIIKIYKDAINLQYEAEALKAFSSSGVISKLILEEENCLILEKIDPGYSLKSYFPACEEESIEIASAVIKRLHSTDILALYNFPNIKDWLLKLDNDFTTIIPSIFLQKARAVRDNLISSSGPEILLHGDLHHDNILYDNKNGWVVIDPKRVIGELEYEISAFIRNPIPDLLALTEPNNIIVNRIGVFAKMLGLKAERISHWCFIQSMLCWIWAIEDGIDTDYWQKVAQIFYRYYQ